MLPLRHILSRLLGAAVGAGDRLVRKKRQLLLTSYPDIDDQCTAVLRWLGQHPEHTFPILLLISGGSRDARRRLKCLGLRVREWMNLNG